MAISDLFRSKLHNSDPEVRAEAVRSLTAEDAETLTTVATADDTAAVRRIAIEQLSDPDALAKVAGAQSDDELARLARQRAAELWVTRALEADREQARAIIGKLGALGDASGLVDLIARASEPSVRDAALDRITEPRALAAVARSEAAQEVRLAAVDRINDAEVLRGIAIDEQTKEIALAAVDRIADHDTLEQVAGKAKLKPVRARARRALGGPEEVVTAEVITDPSEGDAKRIHAERAQLVRVVEELASHHEWVASLQQLEEAERKWAELPSPEAGDELATRFDQARLSYLERREKYASVAEKAAAEAAREAAREREKRAQERAARPQPPPEEKPAPEADKAAEGEPAEPAAAPAAPAAEAAPAEAQPAEAAQPAAQPAPASDKASKREENLGVLRRLVAELETIETIKKLKTAEKKLQKTSQTFDHLSPMPTGSEAIDLIERYHEGHKKLFIRVQELREADEWQRWANVPKREELVARAVALLDAPTDRKLAQKLKDLQAEWKQVGPVPQKRGQELWEKFKSTCDQVYEHVKVQRAQQSEERKVNLEKKRALVEEVEALKESDDWQGTAEKIKRLQAEWKKIGPVPRKHADAIWKQFRGACDHFFERRKPHLDQVIGEQQKNLDAKMSLIEQAEKLAESDDWKETAFQLRELQKRWKTIGFVPRKDANSVNKRFRAACDAFFKRREEHHKELEREKERKLDELGERLDAALTSTDEPATRVEQILALRQEVLSAHGPKGKIAELTDKLQAAQAAVVEACGEACKGTELDPDLSRKRMEKLVSKAEDLAPDDAPAKKPTTAAEMAEQLRRAFSKNALGGVNSQTGGKTPSQQIAELKESWQRLGPVPGPEGAALAERFEAACKRTLDAARD